MMDYRGTIPFPLGNNPIGGPLGDNLLGNNLWNGLLWGDLLQNSDLLENIL